MQNKPSEFTDKELLQEAKKFKRLVLYDAIFFGVLIGIAIYSTLNHGLGFLTFIPIIYIPIATRNKIKNKELEKLLKERKLM